MTRYVYFIFDIVLLVLSSIKSFVAFFWLKSYTVKVNNKSCIILALGPSLTKDLLEIRERASEADIYAVNYFGHNVLFFDIRPRFYVISDALFWRSDVNSEVERDNRALFARLKEVDWVMYLICPVSGRSRILSALKDNENIRFIFVKPIWFNFSSNKIVQFAFFYRLATPMFINVSVLALWHSIINGNRTIELYGADFSFFKEYYVDDITNEVYSNFSHFNKNTVGQSTAWSKYKDDRRKKMHQRLQQCAMAFRQMYLLSVFAKVKNIRIVNRSAVSYLDCFDRK